MQNQNLNRGVFNGAIAGALWGIVFVAPLILQGSSPIEITVARYAWYGLLSLILLRTHRASLGSLRLRDFGFALFFALTGYVGYYLALVAGIREIGAVIPTLIIGTLPVTLAVAGNLRAKDISFRHLVLPSCLILSGLVALNLDQLSQGQNSKTGGDVVIGIAWAMLALAMWTAYGVANAEFLKKRPDVSSSAWSTVCGVATIPLLFLCLPFADSWPTSAELPTFLVITFSMGILSSWGATYFWNNASALLPTGLTGQLVVFETIFGLFYTFLYEHRLPSVAEALGMTLLLIGVLKGVSALRK